MSKARSFRYLYPLFLFWITYSGISPIGYAADKFIRSGASGDGSSWTNAWGDFDDINWASLTSGDTIWVAGGQYNGSLQPQTNGITIKRILASDPASVTSNVAGWNSSFDSLVVSTPSGSAIYFANGKGSGTTIDGRVEGGMRFKIGNLGSLQSGVVMFGGDQSNINLRNLDLAGPAPDSNSYNFVGDIAIINVYGWDGTTHDPVSNVKVESCWVHGGVNLVRLFRSSLFTFDHCKFYDNASSSSIHANWMYISGASSITIRFCDISKWQVEGLAMTGSGPSSPWYIYGNVFHDMQNGGARMIWPCYGIGSAQTQQGPVYFYNNTFVNVNVNYPEGRSVLFAPGSRARNNLYVSSSWQTGSLPDTGEGPSNYAPPSDQDYEYSTQNLAGANSATFTTSPLGANFRLRNNTPAGQSLVGSPGYVPEMSLDATGASRATWSRGAFEFDGVVRHQLSVTITGAGTVSRTPVGNTCVPAATGCSEYASPTAVTLTPIPTGSNVFAGWSGDCSGTGPCTVDVNGFKTATARFSAPPPNVSDGTIINTSGGGIVFNLTDPGTYKIIGSVNAPNSSANSFYVDIDPTGAVEVTTKIWDIVTLTTGFQDREISSRGTGTFDVPQFSPKTWNLAAGIHTLYINTRSEEAGTQIQRIQFVKIGGGGGAFHPADSDKNSALTQDETTIFGSCWRNSCSTDATVDNAARAGTLYVGDALGRYHYNSNLGCPQCWVVGPQ